MHTDTTPQEEPGASDTEAPAQTDQPATLAETARASQTAQVPPDGLPGHGTEQRLHRVRRGRMLGGVAAGLADYFGVDPTIVRVGFVALAFLGGLAVPLYVAGWALIPDEDTDVSIAEELLARERARSAY